MQSWWWRPRVRQAGARQVNSAGTSVSDTWENTIKGAPNDDFYEPSVVAAPVSGRVFVEYTHSNTSLPPRAELATFVPSGTATLNNLREVSFDRRHHAVQRG